MHPTTLLRAAVIAALAISLSPALGCKKEGRPAPARAEPSRIDRYTVRGRIEALPDPAVATSAFYIHHEPIDDFKDEDGAAIGMNSMSMPFPLADGVSLDGYAVGDKVEFVFEVRWGDIGSWEITRLSKLPPETELRSGKANPPAPTGG